jgi:energy-coupling factor transporter transmembrane protein EcfT
MKWNYLGIIFGGLFTVVLVFLHCKNTETICEVTKFALALISVICFYTAFIFYCKHNPSKEQKKHLTKLSVGEKEILLEYLKNLTEGEKHLLMTPSFDAWLDGKKVHRTVEAYKNEVDANCLVNAKILIPLKDLENGKIQYKIDDRVISYLSKEKNFKFLI